jgi:hypothetical protein
VSKQLLLLDAGDCAGDLVYGGRGPEHHPVLLFFIHLARARSRRLAPGDDLLPVLLLPVAAERAGLPVRGCGDRGGRGRRGGAQGPASGDVARARGRRGGGGAAAADPRRGADGVAGEAEEVPARRVPLHRRELVVEVQGYPIQSRADRKWL